MIRSNYDTLTLKLQENLDHYEKYSEKPKEASFFTQLVGVSLAHFGSHGVFHRENIVNSRKNLRASAAFHLRVRIPVVEPFETRRLVEKAIRADVPFYSHFNRDFKLLQMVSTHTVGIFLDCCFFLLQVRSIVMDVRRTIHVSNLEQFSLLQEFASIH